MYVVSWVVWGVVLDNPIYTRDIQPTSRNIGTEQDAGSCIDELEEGVGTFLLFLFALYHRSARSSQYVPKVAYVKVEYRDINVVQQFSVVFYGITAREEDDDFLLQVLLEKGEKKEETAIRRAHDIALRQRRYRTRLLFLVYVDM